MNFRVHFQGSKYYDKSIQNVICEVNPSQRAFFGKQDKTLLQLITQDRLLNVFSVTVTDPLSLADTGAEYEHLDLGDN